MIPTVLIIGLPLGFIFGITGIRGVLITGSAVTLIGWWIVLFTLGDNAFELGIFVASGLLALANLAVSVLLGWGAGQLLRSRFGMTTES